MIEKIKLFLLGVIFAAVLSRTLVMAGPVIRELFFNVAVSFDGVKIEFDEDSQPFIMDGRTYLPVRAIAELAGLYVDFSHGTVALTTSPPAVNAWDGNIFVSESIGMTFSAPLDWLIETEPEILEAYSMMATSPLGASVRLMFVPTAKTAEEFMDTMMIESAAQGMDTHFEPSDTRLPGNYAWLTFSASTTMQMLEMDVNVQGHYFININEGIARVITIISSDISESLNNLLAMFDWSGY